ncbi:MAG: redox-sensing transcriptional repressor Rex [Eubacteriales bacterium]|nr:redox-sensing transcriptional repressor Rex [Eubacteriales bacterium]
MSVKTPPERVSQAVIRRLPRYHRYLGELLKENKLRISSSELSDIMDVTASQIRQDLNCFGGFGQQGYGYNVKYLYGKIGELLGLNSDYTAIIVGAGNLGRALVSSHMFERRGVKRLAMFDIDQSIIGKTFSGIKVYSMDELEDFIMKNGVDIAVLTTPKECAKEVVDRLFATGIKGIWNFSNMELKSKDKNKTIHNMHMGDSLMMLCYEIKKKESTKK